MRRAMYALTGDPIHNGHIDIVERAAANCDELTVGIGVNAAKSGKTLFTLEERLEMAKKALEHLDNVNIVSFKGLLVDYAWEHQIHAVVKSVRNDKDREYEEILDKAGQTQKLDIKTEILEADPELAHLSSTVVKALKIEQGTVHELVPSYVNQCLDARLLGQHIIAVTGEIGSGKSYVSRKLEEIGKERGILVYNIELDHIGHQILDGTLKEQRYETIRKRVVETFGEEVGNPDGTINRKALGDIVFNDAEKMNQLNGIMARSLGVRLKREMYGKRGIILVNAALIAEAGMGYLSNNNTVVVHTDLGSQERRLKARGMTSEQIKTRLGSQYTSAEKIDRLTRDIRQQHNGDIFGVENMDGVDSRVFADLFDNIVRTIDQYGELRFSGLWERLGADGAYEGEYKKLVAAYSTAHRSYHTLKHIVNGLEDYEQAKHLMENPEQVLMAWFYHDFVMKRKSRVDEERSAQAAYGVCKTALLDDKFADGVRDLVRITRHKDAPKTIDEMFIVDIDLAILGKSPEEFDRYEQAIREEYSWVSPEEFRKGRIAVLQSFLDRPTIYHTDFFKEKYEKQAKENLERSIKNLS